jgi:hypothetical protein
MPGHLPAWRQRIPQASTRTADRCDRHQNHDQVVTDFIVQAWFARTSLCSWPPDAFQNKSAFTAAIHPEPGTFNTLFLHFPGVLTSNSFM